MFQAALPLDPIGRPRERHRIVRLKGEGPTCSRCCRPMEEPRQFVQAYTPKDEPYARWREAAVLLLKVARRGAPALSGPLGLRVVFLFPMPKGEHRVREKRPRRWHTSKPDLDNALKAVMDAAVEAGWMADDAPVAQVEVQKIVAEQGAPGAVHVTLFVLPPIEVPAPLQEAADAPTP